jgi:L-lysine exporter family protein LysE/ArgO
MWIAALNGYFVALSLILAIGAQNAFVLRQGLRREYVGPVVAVCAGSDALLIAVGVAGFGAISAAIPAFANVMLWGGAAFLFVYGGLRFLAAWRGGAALMPQQGASASLRSVLATCLVLTWANPHVYLDTVVLIGSIAARFEPYRLAFGIGAVCASLSFFTALGFGARLLGPLFQRPRAWVVLEVVIGCVMWAIAANLVLGALA